MALTVWVLAALVLPLFLFWWRRGAPERARAARAGALIPGPPPLPLIGNALDLGSDVTALLDVGMKLMKKYGLLYRLWAGPLLVVNLIDPQDIEVLLTSNRNLKKPYPYRFIKSWLGEGLLTSFGDRWYKHRKIITPAFHFKILERFVDIFDKQGDILISVLKEAAVVGPIDVCPYVERYTQDVICESAMGVELNAQTGDSASEYLKAVKDACDVVSNRSLRPWYFPEAIFRMTSLARKLKKSIKILHAMTYEVIANRKVALQADSTTTESNFLSEDGSKKKMPFLDLLLLSSKDGKVLSDTDIREEVDTFMFEGHDTASSAILFALFELSRRKDIQDKIITELKEVAEKKSNELCLTMEVLNELKYMEQVIKETLRLYPSVPVYAREITEDLHLASRNVTIPPGTLVSVFAFGLHRNPEIFPDPETFNPDNFVPEAVQKRHHFAYIPFSAGSRNCIGQKFAMLEMKSVLAKIVWNFHLEIDKNIKLKLAAAITLKCTNNIHISFVPRIKS